MRHHLLRGCILLRSPSLSCSYPLITSLIRYLPSFIFNTHLLENGLTFMTLLTSTSVQVLFFLIASCSLFIASTQRSLSGPESACSNVSRIVLCLSGGCLLLLDLLNCGVSCSDPLSVFEWLLSTSFIFSSFLCSCSSFLIVTLSVSVSVHYFLVLPFRQF